MLDGGRSLDRHAWLHLVQGDGGEAAARVLFGAGVVKLRALLMHSDDDINSQHCGCWLYGLTIRCKDLWWLRRWSQKVPTDPNVHVWGVVYARRRRLPVHACSVAFAGGRLHGCQVAGMNVRCWSSSTGVNPNRRRMSSVDPLLSFPLFPLWKKKCATDPDEHAWANIWRRS